jgi:TonB-dependent SusC/RagA subfamily outer membrane receptor
MNLRKYIPIVFLAILFVLLGFTALQNSEDPFITALKRQVSSYFKYKYWEKIYVHCDKPFYKPGEDIWFKAYLTDGANYSPSKTSDVIYVEFINPKGNNEKTLTLQVIQGVCYGNFTIDESAPGGMYKIKAYTNWMRNFGKDYLFEKDIQVQKVVYPRLLAKLDFKRESYGPGDSVIANLLVETLDNTPLLFKKMIADVFLAGKIHSTFNVTTDNKGKAYIQFLLPTDLKSSDGLVNIKIEHEGNTEAISRSIPIVLNKISLRFFPEGGYMVANVPGKVAFKALNEFGKPADIEGNIVDENSSIVAPFKSFHDGMGAVEFTPKTGVRYFAEITKPNIEGKFELPECLSKGYSLKVERRENNTYHVSYYSPVDDKVHLIVQAGKEICFSKTLETAKGMNEANFNADKFHTGTGIITLFDNTGIPRCERLVFFNYQKRLNISLKFDKAKYAPREKVTLKIKTLDANSIPTAANLSVAVINDQLYTLADDKQHNILSWMLLGAEVKGKIEKPSYYFDPEKEDAEKAMDYLLLTQGWRRYQWDDVIKKNYNITHTAEKIGSISGMVIDKRTGMPVKCEVTAMELENRRRILKVNTGTNGSFRFFDADASSTIQLLAHSNEISATNLEIKVTQLNQTQQFSNNNNQTLEKSKLIPEIIKVQAEEIANKGIVAFPENDDNNVELAEDVKNLEEVVITGYGMQRKSDLTAAIAKVVNTPIDRVASLSVEEVLQGRLAGVEITNNTARPGAFSQIKIRGSSSVTNNNNPLFVIDGVVFDSNISGYSSPLQNIPLNNINDITVLKDASATAIYGARGVNGVIVINTTNNRNQSRSIKKPFKPKYTGLIITARQIPVTKEYYYPVYDQKELPEVREDFRSTVYWNPNVTTNNAGDATVEFYTSDEITSFRAIAEGISRNGALGRAEKKYFSQLPFSMAVKFPAYLTYNDTVLMPLIVKNNTDKAMDGKLIIDLPDNLQPLITLPEKLEIASNTAYTRHIPFIVKNISGKNSIKVSFTDGKYRDAFLQEVEVQPKGFPTKLSISGRDNEKRYSFIINKAVVGSIKGEFTAFPDLLTDMMTGIESILREPYGCFEQTSSCTYPNIMALEFLKETGTVNKKVEDKALKYIDAGYKRLIGFETSENGFEWFGHAPAHEGLTSYGLMEFTDMKNVYNNVDEQMIKRTVDWILKKRDGQGGFMRRGYGFGNPSTEVSNAYIVYALSEAAINQVEEEYKLALKEALKSKDPYRLALIANAAYNFKKMNDAEEVMNILNEKATKANWDEITVDHSITRSYGKSLKVESAALYVLALLKSEKPNWLLVNNSVNYLISSRSYGSFGSTQATILALKALKEYTRLGRLTASDGKIEILVNGNTAATYIYKKGDKGKILLGGMEKYLREGENTVVIRYLETESPLPFSFDASWNSLTPQSNKDCAIDIKTSLAAKQTKLGETVRLNIKIANKRENGQPMTMAIVGIPSGLSLQPWQLKEVQEKQLVDFYEITKNYLVLYYRQMLPLEVKELNFDLKTEIPGSYQAPASTGYLYYTNEYKDWADGETIVIKP